MIVSPCISICKTDPLTGFCYGCGRSNNDKKMWKDEKTTDEWKRNNLIEIKSETIFVRNAIVLQTNDFPS